MLSNQYELAILRELRAPYHAGSLASVEIADYVDLPTFQIRSLLKALRRRRLVAEEKPGEWSITERGIQELCASDQLRLVK